MEFGIAHPDMNQNKQIEKNNKDLKQRLIESEKDNAKKTV
jgi:hypothetical protein